MDPGPSSSKGSGEPHPPIYRYTLKPESGQPTQTSIHGIYGWRKRCLYLLLLILVVTVILNFALTIWILRVMDFNVNGMGKLRLVKNGIKVDGDATFLKTLYATQISSNHNSNLNIKSSKNITLTARNSGGIVTQRVVIGDKEFVSFAKKFHIKDHNGKILFSASDNTVTLGASTLEINGSQGIVFREAVETPVLRSHLNTNLRLDSHTGGILITAADDISMYTPGGNLKVLSQSDITLKALNNAIKLDSRNISISGLPVSEVTNNGSQYVKVYQLCLCNNNGKLFLSQPQGNCQATLQICS